MPYATFKIFKLLVTCILHYFLDVLFGSWHFPLALISETDRWRCRSKYFTELPNWTVHMQQYIRHLSAWFLYVSFTIYMYSCFKFSKSLPWSLTVGYCMGSGVNKDLNHKVTRTYYIGHKAGQGLAVDHQAKDRENLTISLIIRLLSCPY